MWKFVSGSDSMSGSGSGLAFVCATRKTLFSSQDMEETFQVSQTAMFAKIHTHHAGRLLDLPASGSAPCPRLLE